MKSKEEITDLVINILADVMQISRDGISASSDLRGDIGADSLDILDVLIRAMKDLDLEDKLESPKITTVGDIVDYLYDRSKEV